MALELAAVSAQAVHLRGQIVRVGYTGTSRRSGATGADHFRIGCYTPILIELTNDDADSFTGVIEARQIDRDGDEVVARLAVMVSGTRRYYLYVPAGESEGRDRFSVRVLQGEEGEEGLARLFDDANQPVRELLPAADPVAIESEARVILDISDVNSLRELVSNTRLNRPVTVLRVAARDLPTDPAGLEMVDTILWDGGDLESFRDPGQREALLEWTRRGGRLVIGASRNWQQLGRSKFGELLPAPLTGTASMSILDSKWVAGFPPEFNPPLTYCPVPLGSLMEGTLPLIPGIDSENPPQADDRVLAARRPFGRGDVVLVTAELRELLDPTRGSNIIPSVLLSRLVGLRTEEVGEDDTGYPREDLYQYIEQQTGFQATTQLYLLFAFIFVVAYVLLATGGSWLWLKQRKLIQHAWASFALVAVAASGVSLLAVHVIRGVGYRVQELTVVDGQAGSPEATAVAYFGLKTPAHTSLDLRLASRGRPTEETPDGVTSLRPLPTRVDQFAPRGYQFQGGQRYEAVAALGELRAVPIRATLKQLEGFWRGTMGGRVRALLHRRGSELRADSYILNDLGTNLTKCHLLVPSSNSGWPDRRSIYGIRSYYLGDLANGQRITFAQIEDVMRKQAGLGPDDRLQPDHLSTNQDNWLRRFGIRMDTYGRADAEEEKVDLGKLNEALILVSTFDEINRKRRKEVSRSQAQHLDRSLALSSRMAMLIGFSEDPGPATLCWRPAGDRTARWRPLPSEPGRKVMYRIAIPIEPW